MNWILNRCRRQRQDISLLAAGVLPQDERAKVQEHLASCPSCRKLYQELTNIVRPLAGWEKEMQPIEPNEAMRRRWTRAVLAVNEAEFSERPGTDSASAGWWREVIWPYRRIWAGMGAAWLVMWFINASTTGVPGGGPRFSATPATLQAVAEERRVLAELIPPIEVPQAEPPRADSTKPRSERQRPWVIG